MKIAFIDPTRAYAADAPWQGPLGGTQSATCYLAIELARQGHTVALYNHIDPPREARGVTAYPWMQLYDGDAALYDALVLVGRWTAQMVEELARFGRPLIGWMHEAAFHPEIIVPHPQLTGLVFVSQWQQRVNAPETPADLPTYVIENAISPFAEAQPATEKDPTLAIFAGDAARGLIPLLEIWPRLQALQPDLTLEVYSGLTISRRDDINAAFATAVQQLPGLKHVGKVGQQELAVAMARATWHLSPNPYPETSCITLLEALALGCRSVVTARAALPESAHGFATVAAMADGDNHRENNVPVSVDNFVIAFEQAQATTPDLAAQQAHFRMHHSWAVIAATWAELLSRVMAGKATL